MLKRFGMLWIAHGSRDPKWVAGLDDAWEAVRSGWDGPAFLSFLELVDGRLIQDGINALEEAGVTDLIIVPMFVSSGSTHTEEIAWALGIIPTTYHETDMERLNVHSNVHWVGPMDEDEKIISIIRERAQAITIDPANEILLMIGHGSEVLPFENAWRRQLHRFGQRLRDEIGFSSYEFATIMPLTVRQKVESLNQSAPERTVVAIPIFISPGYYTAKKIPGLLEGLNCRYTGDTLLPDLRVAEWAISKANERRAKEEALT